MSHIKLLTNAIKEGSVEKYKRAVKYEYKTEHDKYILYSIQFHYFFSHGDYESLKNVLPKMNKNDTSYIRHKIKFDVLHWWIHDYVPFTKGNMSHEVVMEKYNTIMASIYSMLDSHRSLEKTNSNAYQMIRDHVFYFKMGLFCNDIQVMTYKLKKWFLKCDLPKEFLNKMNVRIDKVKEEYNKYNRVYLGMMWDDIPFHDKLDENIIYFVPPKIKCV